MSGVPIPSMQSVFLGDITSAYEKNPNLESLLFDGFFNKGGRLWPSTLVDLCTELGSQLSTKHSRAGDGLLLRLSSGASRFLRSAQHLPSSTGTAVTFSQPISSRRSAITLVLTPSVSSQGRRTRGSRPARIFVSVLFQLPNYYSLYRPLVRRQLDWSRWQCLCFQLQCVNSFPHPWEEL